MMLFATIVVFAYVNAVHLVALIRKDNSIMDAAWGLGFVILSWATLIMSGDISTRKILLSVLVTIWGIRLCIHILVRSRGRGEDFRYRNWRTAWGRWFHLRSYFQIYILQGVFMFIVAMPIILVNSSHSGIPGLLDFIGLTIWLTGFLFEAVGDFQLLRFMKDGSNKGRIMRYGLWKFVPELP